LRDLYQRTQPAADGEVRIFYASALAAAGQIEEAKKLLSRWPLPDAGGDPLFQSLVFPRFLELRRKAGMR
jgi:tetratricopeptide repeat protein